MKEKCSPHTQKNQVKVMRTQPWGEITGYTWLFKSQAVQVFFRKDWKGIVAQQQAAWWCMQMVPGLKGYLVASVAKDLPLSGCGPTAHLDWPHGGLKPPEQALSKQAHLASSPALLQRKERSEWNNSKLTYSLSLWSTLGPVLWQFEWIEQSV